MKLLIGKTLKTKLSDDWMPSDRVLELATSRNMPIKDWLYHLLPEFKLYWIDRDVKRDSWDSTFWWLAKKKWEDVDKRSLYEKNTPEYPRIPQNTPETAQKPIERTTQKPKIETFSQEKRIEQCDKFLKELKH